MHRAPKLTVLVAASVAAVALGGSLAYSSATSQGVQFRPVNIRVTCSDGQVDEVNIRPWTANLSRNQSQQLRWQLTGGGPDSVTIRPKSNSSWPFDSSTPLTVSAGGNGTPSGAISGADGTYYYDIVANCGDGATVIDPRMDIRP